MELRVRNVQEALYFGRQEMVERGIARSSRNGAVLEIPEPVMTIYERPWERVLFCPNRDANPFLHFFESLWMLAGREDLKFMQELNARFAQYSDDGILLQGAYGYRWRSRFGYDQISQVVRELQTDPNSRRAVLAMWSASDLLNTESKDIPCNTHIYFKIRAGRLHMTVCCRSNDMLWGAYGANAVHFSFLQEYVAAHLHIHMGPLVQISDSLHVYTEGDGGKVWQRIRDQGVEIRPYPKIAEPSPGGNIRFVDDDIDRFFYSYDAGHGLDSDKFKSPFMRETAIPMWLAFQDRDIDIAENIQAPDWKIACTEWLKRRRK